jgi:hypothetical protein
MKITKNTIDAVLFKAVGDAAFLKALLKDPEKACDKAKPEPIVLSKADMKHLKKSLTKKNAITGGELLSFVNRLMSDAKVEEAGKVVWPWPPPPPFQRCMNDVHKPVKPTTPKEEIPG